MDLQKACSILEISLPFTLPQLKKTYHRNCLRYHPDKNGGTSTEKFQNICAAYEFLCIFLEVQEEIPKDNTYSSLFKEFLQSILHIDITNTMLYHEIISGCKNISLKAFEGIDKLTAIDIYTYLEQYADVLNINEEILESIKKLIKEKLKNDEFIILHSTIQNCINGEVYVLNHNGNVFYIPLWHEELTFDLSDPPGFLIVKCIPNLPDYMTLDNNNHLHVNITTSISSLLNKETLDVNVGDKVFEIPVKKLTIQKNQIYTFHNQGIPMINTKNIYNDINLGNIIIHIELNN